MNSNARPFAALHPDIGTGPVSTMPAVDPAFFEKEREHIFRKMWINMILREEDLPNAGDYFVRDIEVLDVSVIVVRGDDGKLRAVHNVCPHRGNRLVREDGGNRKGFQCDFHGWVFDNQGELVFVTDEQRFHDLDKPNLGLAKVHLDTWRGFVYVNLEETPSQTLEASMADFNQDLKPFPFENMVLAGRYRYEAKANWKTTMNAFQESYHAAFVHKRSVQQCLEDDADPYLASHRIKLQPNGNQSISVHLPPHELTPTEMIAYGMGATFTQGGDADQAAIPGTAQEGIENWAFDLNIMFPFSRINVGAGWYYVDAFWPITHDRTVYELAFYFPIPTSAGAMISQEYSKIVLRDLSREDLFTNEVTHNALRSGAIKSIQLSDQEIAVRHQYEKVTEFCGTESAGDDHE
ncbi:MAG: aromatic ring-hydroxylating dioxygenase subunit alpha [Immundisolibacteraceae bacterium]|nr:aromatic ring-hydroxylating dioxygenase subunit alpha [Immundisolibacteraceae bacterium]